MHITSNNQNMNRHVSQSPQFMSRNKFIRNLDDINLLVRREFPVVSNTFIVSRRASCDQAYKLFRYSSGLIEEVRGFSKIDSNPTLSLLKTVDTVKQFRVGNCGEMSLISYLACRLNKIKDVKEMFLCAYNTKTGAIREIDHSVIGLNFKKQSAIKPKNYDNEIYFSDNSGIIFDSWIGKVDYGRNMAVDYRHSEFGKNLLPDEKLCYAVSSKNTSLSSSDLLYLENKYPELVKHRKNGLFKRLRYKFINKEKYNYAPIRKSLKETYRRNSNLDQSLDQNKISEMIQSEIKNELALKMKKRNFFQRFMDEVNAVAAEEEKIYDEWYPNGRRRK